MSWYFDINAADIPDVPFNEEGVAYVIKICGIGSFIGALIILSAIIHTIHFMAFKNDDPAKNRVFYFELVILCLFLMSCLGMSLGRSDAIIPGDFTLAGCWLGYYFQVIAYTLGKLLTYLFFCYRVKCAFKKTSFTISASMKYVVIAGILCYSVVIFLQILLLPLAVDSWIWVHAGNVKMCVIPSAKLPPIITSSFGTLPFIDAIFCGYLCFFFVRRLRSIRLFILQFLIDDAKPVDHRQISIHTVTESDKEDNEDKDKGKEKEKEKGKEKDTENGNETENINENHTETENETETDPAQIEMKKVTNSVIANTLSEEDKKLIKDIEFLVWKQTILIIVALITTMATVWWIWILPIFTNLIVFDAIVDAVCVHLIFSFCNPFWNLFKDKCCCY